MHQMIEQTAEAVSKVLLGKHQQVRLALCCLLSGGHLLIEDLPGLGKTTLAHALAKVFGLQYQRVQFTSDMLPGDLLGVSVFNPQNGGFVFHKGPVFSQLLLADEINRSTPKTQSALLEAMEERQVSIEGQTWSLPEPFFVIATQNPLSQYGTFPLPESQLDRFLMRIQLGYPSASAERELLKSGGRGVQLETARQLMDIDAMLKVKEQAVQVKVSERLLDYLQALVQWSREQAELAFGVSPRAALGLLACAKTWALMEGRDYVIPEDLQLLAPTVLAHRLRTHSEYGEQEGIIWVERMLSEVDLLG